MSGLAPVVYAAPLGVHILGVVRVSTFEQMTASRQHDTSDFVPPLIIIPSTGRIVADMADHVVFGQCVPGNLFPGKAMGADVAHSIEEQAVPPIVDTAAPPPAVVLYDDLGGESNGRALGIGRFASGLPKGSTLQSARFAALFLEGRWRSVEHLTTDDARAAVCLTSDPSLPLAVAESATGRIRPIRQRGWKNPHRLLALSARYDQRSAPRERAKIRVHRVPPVPHAMPRPARTGAGLHCVNFTSSLRVKA